MTRLTRLCRAVGVGIAVTTATLAMTQVANAAPAPPTPPTSRLPLWFPSGNQVFLVGHGKGVQIYQCNGDHRRHYHLQLGLRRTSGRL